MHHTKSVALVAALAGISAATPVDITGKSSFRVNQVVSPRKSNLTPAQKYLKAYAKYGKLHAAPEKLVAAASSGQSGSVTATPEQYDEVRLEFHARKSPPSDVLYSPTCALSHSAAKL